LDLAAVD
jgi:pimeloyl-ACP methyl ester carboxylesterase